jgi:uncharacterized protein (UPF0335 family)
VGATPGAAGAAGDGEEEDEAAEEREQLREAQQKAKAIGFCAKMLSRLIEARKQPATSGESQEPGLGWA